MVKKKNAEWTKSNEIRETKRKSHRTRKLSNNFPIGSQYFICLIMLKPTETLFFFIKWLKHIFHERKIYFKLKSIFSFIFPDGRNLKFPSVKFNPNTGDPFLGKGSSVMGRILVSRWCLRGKCGFYWNLQIQAGKYMDSVYSEFEIHGFLVKSAIKFTSDLGLWLSMLFVKDQM